MESSDEEAIYRRTDHLGFGDGYGRAHRHSRFIIGNTTENIVQELSCSLIAFKLEGFVSPVKAY